VSSDALVSLFCAASGIRDAPGVMKPALEFLKLVVDLAQNALDRSECGIADGCGVENQNNPLRSRAICTN